LLTKDEARRIAVNIASVAKAVEPEIRKLSGAAAKKIKPQFSAVLRLFVARVRVQCTRFYAPACKSGACPFDAKLNPDARHTTRTVSWGGHLLDRSGQELRQRPFSFG
jgi:hypothetical protein